MIDKKSKFLYNKFSYSYKKQMVAPKRAYSIDNGLSNANSVSFSNDDGRMLENAAFLALRRKYRDVFYYSEKNECDFIIKEKEKITLALQVCYELNEENEQREVDGLVEAMKAFGLKKGLILTSKQEDELKVENCAIKVIPLWKWLLNA